MLSEMTSIERFLPSIRRVVMVAPPGASALTTLGPLEAFDVANRFLAARGRPPLYQLQLASLDADSVSSVGVPLRGVPLSEVREVHTLIVGGGPTLPERTLEPALVGEVGRLAAAATRVVSVCGGAFVLGALGLLAGRRCTTHWLWLDALQQRFPEARVEPDAIYTEDGPVWTSAGVTAGLDLALQLIRSDGGPGLARAVARALVVFVHRPGGQAQFSAALTVTGPKRGAGSALDPALDDRIRALVVEVIGEPGGEHDVPALARRMAMSPRNFARVFRARTGETPAAFVARARIEAAQRALADTDATLAAIASACGFGTEATLRRTFARVVGVSPSGWRERFAR